MSETDTDIDEPPTKISKIQDEKPIEEEHLEAEEEEEMVEGQEEWLSEGILTDDDYNPGTEQETLDPSLTSACENSQMSQDDETPSLDDSTEQQTASEDKSWTTPVQTEEVNKEENDSTCGTTDGIEPQNSLDQCVKSEDHQLVSSTTKSEVQNIEEALNSFETKTELTDVLDTFLIRKPGVKTEEREVSNKSPALEQQNDDGNDTDDLLRLLGDDDNKLKKKVLVKKSNKNDVNAEDSSDDEFSYELAASVKKIRVARNVLMKGRPASKAVPEDLSDGGNYAGSSDEVNTVKKMFCVTTKKSTSSAVNHSKKPVKHVLHVNKPLTTAGKPGNGAPKQYVNKTLPSSDSVAGSKPAIKIEGKPTNFKMQTKLKTKETGPKSGDDKQHVLNTDVKLESTKPVVKLETTKPVAKSEAAKPVAKLETAKPVVKSEAAKRVVKFEILNQNESQESEEIIDEEEFLEEDEDYELDEDEFGEESETEEGSRRQRIMRPERMDEEVPSDADTHTEDGSLYDEIPSSDSEDLDDWFTLDIRAERAGDYLPLLGPKARELLIEEKKRVSMRLATLRQSLSALTESGRKQAEQLRQATMSLAELDDMLKAT